MDDALRLFRSTREYLTPVLSQSAFYDHGMLTPEEFVRAGDHLVRTCPSWQWASGEKAKLRPYLPNEKQFLITRRVPSYSRAEAMRAASVVETAVAGGIGASDAEWCAAELVARNPDDEYDLTDMGEAAEADGVDTAAAGIGNMAVKNDTTSSANATAGNEDDDYLDMEDESLALDEATAAPAADITSAVGKGPASTGYAAPLPANQLLRTRRYDVSMTYDNYYRTPRIWLYGFDENGSELTPEDVFQDIMQDYAKKTVTIDPHPHLTKPHASIHPCQHGSAMLNIINSLKASDREPPTVEQYLFFFLKFIQSVVPTIEYDNTVDVQVRDAGK